ncbi:MAG: hypothetical protein F4Z15_07475 [Gammaproteobacteria bacterium]|nr:hypothetical protein [Gammaproteobacteria bacterium]MYD75599.1 hypothetical protein [Gammaproteobacteria bacterium]
MYIMRTQYPVGQGSFHAGSILDKRIDGGQFHYVYDCGSANRKALSQAIKNYKDRTSRVDALFVSHLDNDRVNGLELLLDAVKVDKVYIPHANDTALVMGLIQAESDGTVSASLLEASLNPVNWFRSRGVEQVIGVRESLGTGDSDTQNPAKVDSTIESGDRVPISARDDSINWTLVPHVDPAPSPNGLDRFQRGMRNIFGLSGDQRVDSEQLSEAMRNKNVRKNLRHSYCTTIHWRPRCHTDSLVSMSLYSGPIRIEEALDWDYQIHCGRNRLGRTTRDDPGPQATLTVVGWIGTGDATLSVEKSRAAWRGTYKPYEDYVCTVLLPHRYAACKSHFDLYHFDTDDVLGFKYLEICATSADNPNSYSCLFDSFTDLFFHVSQKPDTELVEEILFSQDSRLELIDQDPNPEPVMISGLTS